MAPREICDKLIKFSKLFTKWNLTSFLSYKKLFKIMTSIMKQETG